MKKLLTCHNHINLFELKMEESITVCTFKNRKTSNKLVLRTGLCSARVHSKWGAMH